jgi:hypothetical protein
MTVDPNLYITLSVSGLAGLAMVTAAGLSGWRGWLALKRQELAEHRHRSQAEPAMPGRGLADRDRRPEGAHPQARGDRRRGGLVRPRPRPGSTRLAASAGTSGREAVALS